MVEGQTSQELIGEINGTFSNLTDITFEQAYAVTSDPAFFIPVIILTVLPILIFLIWGAFAKARTSSGEAIPNTNAIQTANFWIIFTIFFFFGIILDILVIVPLWLKLF